MRRLAAKPDEAGYCHFRSDYPEEYYEQMTAEELVTRYHKGFKRQEFVAKRKRNEVFDCRVYATAALELTGINLEAHRRQLQIQLEERKRAEQEKPETPQRKKSRRAKGSWVDEWWN